MKTTEKLEVAFTVSGSFMFGILTKIAQSDNDIISAVISAMFLGMFITLFVIQLLKNK